MSKPKRDKITVPATETGMLLLVIAVICIGIALSVGRLNLATEHPNFDYTRDRDQYWYPALSPETFDYTRDRDQYWYPALSPETFDYLRDRDQYWYPALSPETFDYLRDRDQYWY